MRKQVLILITPLLCLSLMTLCAQNEFVRIFGQNPTLMIADQPAQNTLVTTSDGNLVFSTMFPPLSLFIKMDMIGNVIFTKSFSNSGLLPADLIATSDKGFLVTGHSHLFDTLYHATSSSSAVLSKIDSAGNIQWNRIMGRYGGYGKKVGELDDSTYCGVAADTARMGDIYYYIISKNGNLKHAATFGGAKSDGPFSILCSNGSFYVLSFTQSFNPLYEMMLTKINRNGAIDWTKTYLSPGCAIGGFCMTKKDNNKFCIGGSAGWGSSSDGLLVMEVDSNGSPLNAKVINIDSMDYITSVASNNNLGYLLISLSTPNSQLGPFYSVILDNNLNIVYKNRLGINSFNAVGTMGPSILRKNNNIYTAGVSYTNSSSGAYSFIQKLDSTGAYSCSTPNFSVSTFSIPITTQTLSLTSYDLLTYYSYLDTLSNIVLNDSIACNSFTTGNTISAHSSQLKIFPNPSSGGNLTIQSAEPIRRITLFNNLGVLLNKFDIDKKSANLDLSLYDETVFYLEIETASGVTRKKVLSIQ